MPVPADMFKSRYPPNIDGGQQLLDHFHGMSSYPLLFTRIQTHHYNRYVYRQRL